METVIVAGALVFVNLMTLLLGVVTLLEVGKRFLDRVKTVLDERDSAAEAPVVECQRMCITLKNNEGEFIGLCTERSSKRWTFEQAVTVPDNPGTVSEKLEGTLHVPPGNISMYQVLTEVHHAPDA